MAIQMGMGALGSDGIIFKRKFRWTFSLEWQGNQISNYFVKIANRPTLNIEETPINFLNGRMYLPGKGEWDTLSVTFYDVGAQADAVATSSMGYLYSWLASVYDFTRPETLQQSSSATGYGGTGTLRLYDGCGEEMEVWTLKKMFPTSVNFGDLDYSSSDEVTIEVTLRFTQATYESKCPGFNIDPRCDGCGFFQAGSNTESASAVQYA